MDINNDIKMDYKCFVFNGVNNDSDISFDIYRYTILSIWLRHCPIVTKH